MRGFLAVCQREIVERRLLLLAAGLAGLAPLVVPYLRGASGQNTPDIQGGTALVLSMVFSAVLAVILGGSVISRDLAERRLSFYFSRPLSGPAIWAGKMAAATLLVFGSGALVLLPAWLVGASVDPSGHWGNGLFRGSGEIVLASATLVSLLLLASHAASVMMRSRSPWLLFDLAALGSVAALVWSASEKLLLEGAVTPAFRIVISLLVVVPLALLASSLVQVIRGRTDLHRGHRWLSVTLWSLLLVSGLASAAYAYRVLAIAPEDLEEIAFVKAAPAGSWIVLGGETRDRDGFNPTFLIDTSSGRFVRLRAAISLRQLGPEISADGRRAVWLARQRNDFDSPAELMTLDLTRPEATPVATPVTFPMTYLEIVALALSPDGSRLATLRRGRLFVDEVSTGRTLVSIPFPASGREAIDNQRMLFLSSGLIRIYRSVPFRTDIYEADLRTRKLTQTGGDEQSLWPPDLGDSGSGRIPVWDLGHGLLCIRDGRTGNVLATFPTSHREWTGSALLTRGRVAIPVDRKGSWDLKILAQDGSESQRFHFDSAYSVQAGPQPGPDHLVTVTWKDRSRVDQAWLLDLENGATRLLGEGLVPVSRSSSPGSLGSQLFLEGGDRLVRFDPLRGGKRVVLDLR